jgi:hypothetical protein
LVVCAALSALLSSDPPHTLDVHAPAFVDQHPVDPTIAVASIPHRQPFDRRRKCRLIIANSRTTALRRPRLTDNPTWPAFRDGNPGAHMRNAGTSAGRAQYFPSLPSGSACPASAQILPSSDAGSPAQGPSGASPDRPSARHTGDATGSSSGSEIPRPRQILPIFSPRLSRTSASRNIPIACSGV